MYWERDYYMIARDTFQDFYSDIRIIYLRDSLENVFGLDYIEEFRTIRFDKMKSSD